MNDRQNTVVATVIAALILGGIFLCPWRVESSGALRWSPIYQPPLSYVRTYGAEYGREGGSRIETAPAHIAVDVLIFQIVAIGVVGGLLYVLSSSSDGDDEARRMRVWE